MAASIKHRVTESGVADVPLVISTSQEVSGSISASPVDPLFHSGEFVSTFDWTNLNGIVFDVTSTVTVASRLFDYLNRSNMLALPIHLIGHSRGASLVSALSAYMGQAGIWVDQVTSLDAHPLGAGYDPTLDFGDAPPIRYWNVLFGESYFRAGDGGPDGYPLLPSHEVDLNGIVTGPAFSTTAHSGVHAFYEGTIDQSASDDGDGSTIYRSWYTYPSTTSRGQVGFYWSRVGGGLSARPTDGLASGYLGGTAVGYPVQPSGSQWPNIAGIRLNSYSLTPGQTAQTQFYYGDRDSSETVTLYLDNDENPYNGMGRQVATTTLATATMAQGTASWSSSGVPSGSYHLLAMASDGVRARFDYAPQAVVINQPPTIATFSATPTVLPYAGGNFLLQATGVSDSDGTVTEIGFFRDTGNGTLGAEDILVGEDFTASDGYTASVSTASLSPGTYRFFAVAQDNVGAISAARTITVRVNAEPTISSIASPSAQRLGTATLTASGVTDNGEPGFAGAVSQVEFFRDRNGNGVIDAADGARLGLGVRVAGTDDWRLPIALGADWPLGSNQVLARAQDNSGAWSATAVGSVTVSDALPTVTSLATSPAVISLRGSVVTLTTSGVADRDGSVASVEFYRDSNGNNLFDPGADFFLGSDSSAAGGFTLSAATDAFPFGMNRVFAVAVDNDGQRGAAVSATVRVNAPPTVASISGALPEVPRGTNAVLTALGVVDGTEVPSFAGAITLLQFYRDMNGNNAIDQADRLLGSGTRQGLTNNYTLSFATTGFPVGQTTILVRATDNSAATSSVMPFALSVANAAPVLTGATAAPTTVLAVGQPVTITATAPRDSDGAVAAARFYLDSNADGNLQADQNAPGHDLLLGEDLSPTGGWSLATPTLGSQGFQPGANRVFVRVIDNDGASSTVATTFAINALPTVGGLTASPNPVNRRNTTTLTATGLADPDGTVSRVEFILDVNGDQVFQPGVDRSLGFGTATAGHASLAVNTTGFPAGAVTVFARAQDNRSAYGQPVSSTVTVNNLPPTIATVTGAPNPVVSLGGTLTLTAGGVADQDGTISAVDFFHDVNGNGAIDPGTDVLLGTDTSATGGYTLAVNTGNAAFQITEGTRQFIARATDNNGGTGIRLGSVRINAAPVIGGLVVTPDPILRSGRFTATVTGVTDDVAVTAVRLYRDSNGNGVYDAADILLGNATRVGVTSSWVFSAAGTVLPVGSYRVFARAVDASGQTSLPSHQSVSVV